MTTPTPASRRPPDSRQSRDAATWLGLAASPTFALMTWISASDMQASDMQTMICATRPGILPISGMAWMYLLMSFFHLPPWLKLVSVLSRQSAQPTPEARGG